MRNGIKTLTALGLGASFFMAGCQEEQKSNTPLSAVNPSTYEATASQPVLFQNVTLMDGLGEKVDQIDVLLSGQKVTEIGVGLKAPDNAVIIDGLGKVLTPGLVDVHTHYGNASMPYATGDGNNWDVNEDSIAITPEVRAEHGVWVQDPLFDVARRGGVTTVQVLPGSANLIAGLSVVLKNVPATTVQAMKFPNAPYGLKMACGENPKDSSEKKRAPFSRLGNVAAQRAAWMDAQTYQDVYKAGRQPRDLGLETLVAAMRGEVKIHAHCYRSDDMAHLIDMSHEFGFQVAAFHHAVEAYKIADLLKKEDICSAVWSDWWGFKWEALDGIPENAAFLEAAGACAIIHSDTAFVGQMLMVETAKALAAAHRAGIEISKAEALRWVTSNPARAMGLADQIGSIEVGKNADVVLWSGDPFSVFSKAERVFIDGTQVYSDANPSPNSDFLLGQPAREGIQ